VIDFGRVQVVYEKGNVEFGTTVLIPIFGFPIIFIVFFLKTTAGKQDKNCCQ
jgi:hypothetical protein